MYFSVQKLFSKEKKRKKRKPLWVTGMVKPKGNGINGGDPFMGWKPFMP